MTSAPFLTSGSADALIAALMAALGAVGTFLIAQLKAKDRQIQELQKTKDTAIKELTDSMFDRVMPALEKTAVAGTTMVETAGKMTEVTQRVVSELATAVERQRRGGP